MPRSVSQINFMGKKAHTNCQPDQPYQPSMETKFLVGKKLRVLNAFEVLEVILHDFHTGQASSFFLVIDSQTKLDVDILKHVECERLGLSISASNEVDCIYSFGITTLRQ